MKRLTSARTGTPYVRTTCVVMGERQIEVLEAMCALNGRRPNQLVADIVLGAIKVAQADQDLMEFVGLARKARGELPEHSGLRLVHGDE